jgi:hypothetical protein
MSETRSDSGVSFWLGHGYTAVLVSAVMLPVIGVVVRLVTFRFGGPFQEPLHLAGSASVADLALVGSGPILIAGGAFVVGLLAPFPGGRLASPMRLAAVITLALILGSIPILLVAPSPLLILAIVLTLATAYLAHHRTMKRPWSSRRLATVLGITFVITGLFTGLYPRPYPAAYYTLAAEVPLVSGWFIRVGEAGGAQLLADCVVHGRVVAIPAALILTVDTPAARNDLDLLATARAIGREDFFENCP